MRLGKTITCFFAVALLCSASFGQASIDIAMNEYNKKKAELIKPVLEAFDAEIKAAREKGDEVKAKQLSVEREAFIRQEEPSQKLALNDAIREYQKRAVDLQDLSSSVQRSKLLNENIEWLEKNLSRRQIKLEFRVGDVQEAGNGYYDVYFGECDTNLGGFVELRKPNYYRVKLSEKQAQEIGMDHRLLVSGIPEVGRVNPYENPFPVFFIDQNVTFEDTSNRLGVFMKDPAVKLIEK